MKQLNLLECPPEKDIFGKFFKLDHTNRFYLCYENDSKISYIINKNTFSIGKKADEGREVKWVTVYRGSIPNKDFFDQILTNGK